MNTRMAVAFLMMLPAAAVADGERTPMFGGALTYVDDTDRRTEFVGGELELAWWSGRFGLAAEASANRAIADDTMRNLAVGGSARFLVTNWMWPSLFEPRDVELGVELQAIAARTWWSRDDSSDAYGLGLAIRMRGGSDWEFSSLLAESRLFVRVMRPRDGGAGVLARTAGMAPSSERDLTVVVGLGAAFGAGEPRYLERFRLRSFDGAQ